VLLSAFPVLWKTTVGALVAAELRRCSSDLDDLIEREQGTLGAGYLLAAGEKAFRELDARPSVGPCPNPSVIAPGGGWAAQPRAMDARASAFSSLSARRPEEAARLRGTWAYPAAPRGADPADACGTVYAPRAFISGRIRR